MKIHFLCLMVCFSINSFAAGINDFMPLNRSWLRKDYKQLETQYQLEKIFPKEKSSEKLAMIKFGLPEFWNCVFIYAKDGVIDQLTYTIVNNPKKASLGAKEIIKKFKEYFSKKDFIIKKVPIHPSPKIEQGYLIAWLIDEDVIAIKFGPLDYKDNYFGLQLILSTKENRSKTLGNLDFSKPNDPELVVEINKYLND